MKIFRRKTNILLEVSFKEIGDKISKAIKFLKEKIKNLFDKIKNFRKSKKLEEALKRIHELEKM